MPYSISLPSTTQHQPSTVRDYISLLKPGVMSLVVFTGFAGMVLAITHHPSTINLFQQLIAIACIALGSGAGAAVNMWYDRDIDAVMKRTQNRPLPLGIIAPDNALALGLFLSALAVMLMSLALNPVAAAILAFAIFFYAVVYTMWLKRSTPQNIVIGGAAGAFPPMIGWAAATGDITLSSFILFLIIFLWTPPHFWALALYKCGDYAKADVPMMPVVAGQKHTKKLMFTYTFLLLLCTLSLPVLGLAGMVYGAAALVLGVMFLYYVWRVYVTEGDRWPKKTFGFSIVYLFTLFTALMIDATLL